jgi:hypothetical protein
MNKKRDLPPYMVAIVKPDALSNVAVRLASLAEALEFCRTFEERDETEARAVIFADKLPDPPFVGSCFQECD